MIDHPETEAHRVGAVRGEQTLNLLGLVYSEEVVTDLVVDLLHATTCHGGEAEAVVTFAMRHYEAEIGGDEAEADLAPEPDDAAEPPKGGLTLLQGGAA